MSGAVLYGIGLGLVMSLAAGPIFFTIINLSLARGFWMAASFALGVFIADVIYAILAVRGVLMAFRHVFETEMAAILGGVVLVTFGIVALLSSPKRVSAAPPKGGPGAPALSLALSGFVFNASQPTILAFWIGVATHADSTYPGQVEVYIVAALLTVVAVDLLKSALGHKLAVLLTDNMLKWANRVFGVLLIVFGFFVALQAFVR